MSAIETVRCLCQRRDDTDFGTIKGTLKISRRDQNNFKCVIKYICLYQGGDSPLADTHQRFQMVDDVAGEIVLEELFRDEDTFGSVTDLWMRNKAMAVNIHHKKIISIGYKDVRYTWKTNLFQFH